MEMKLFSRKESKPNGSKASAAVIGKRQRGGIIPAGNAAKRSKVA